ncbi:hypothetical protein DFP73DRAFT_545696, partial [Morchella snyderi]
MYDMLAQIDLSKIPPPIGTEMSKMVQLQMRVRMALMDGVVVDEKFVKAAFLKIDNATDVDIQAWAVNVVEGEGSSHLPDNGDVVPGASEEDEAEPSNPDPDGAEPSDFDSNEAEPSHSDSDEAEPSDFDSNQAEPSHSDSDEAESSGSDSDEAESLDFDSQEVEPSDTDHDAQSLGTCEESGRLCNNDVEPFNLDDHSDSPDLDDVSEDYGSLNVEYPSSEAQSEGSIALNDNSENSGGYYWSYIGNGYWISPYGEAVYWFTPYAGSGYWTSLFAVYGIWGNPFKHSCWVDRSDQNGYWVGAWNNNGDFEGEYFLYKHGPRHTPKYHYWLNPNDAYGYLRGAYNDNGDFEGEYIRFADHCATCNRGYAHGSGPEPPIDFPYRGPHSGHDHYNDDNGNDGDNGYDDAHQPDNDQEANDADDEDDGDDEPNDNEEASSDPGDYPANRQTHPGGNGEEATPEIDWGEHENRISDLVDELEAQILSLPMSPVGPTSLVYNGPDWDFCRHCGRARYRGVCQRRVSLEVS